MANFYEDVNVCDRHMELVKGAVEDHIMFDNVNNPSLPILEDEDEPATFCVQCRTFPSSGAHFIDYNSGMRSPSSRWVGESTRGNKVCSCGVTTLNTSYQPQLVINSDGSDVPLLSNVDGYVNGSVRGGAGLDQGEENSELTNHCHWNITPERRESTWKSLLAASIMCLVFMVTEVVGGYLAGSLAVMTDAAHLLSDFVGFVVSLFAIWLSHCPPTKQLSFGYHRAEVLGALVSISIIWVLTGICVFLAVVRIKHQDFEIEADTMMIVSALGIIINIAMGVVLHAGCCNVRHLHGHSHHSYSSSLELEDSLESRQTRPRNINLRAAIIHVLGDLILSVGVFISAVVIKAYPSAKLADPICTFIFSALVILTTAPVVRDAVHVLMEGWPRHGPDHTSLRTALLSGVPGVQAIHGLHLWSLTLSHNALAVHLAIDSSADPEQVLLHAQRLLHHKFDIQSSTIQVEKFHPAIMLNCLDCQNPP
ncbi:proton-coupled zinc antiporter SLC30A2-like [Hetaerina americana]|uniref:proton-coupled zinc antiporter SLC30A2-like n=1 Tax=Hetaerina americana TaxID=62018 RepID=UPI003A7F214C